MPFFLHRVRFRVGDAVDGNFRRVNFRRLFGAGRLDDFAFNGNRAAGCQTEDVRLIIFQRVGRENLDVVQTRSVVEFNKTESCFGIAAGSNPAFQ